VEASNEINRPLLTCIWCW